MVIEVSQSLKKKKTDRERIAEKLLFYEKERKIQIPWVMEVSRNSEQAGITEMKIVTEGP